MLSAETFRCQRSHTGSTLQSKGFELKDVESSFLSELDGKLVCFRLEEHLKATQPLVYMKVSREEEAEPEV